MVAWQRLTELSCFLKAAQLEEEVINPFQRIGTPFGPFLKTKLAEARRGGGGVAPGTLKPLVFVVFRKHRLARISRAAPVERNAQS